MPRYLLRSNAFEKYNDVCFYETSVQRGSRTMREKSMKPFLWVAAAFIVKPQFHKAGR